MRELEPEFEWKGLLIGIGVIIAFFVVLALAAYGQST